MDSANILRVWRWSGVTSEMPFLERAHVSSVTHRDENPKGSLSFTSRGKDYCLMLGDYLLKSQDGQFIVVPEAFFKPYVKPTLDGGPTIFTITQES